MDLTKKKFTIESRNNKQAKYVNQLHRSKIYEKPGFHAQIKTRRKIRAGIVRRLFR
jgi:hypothetical protein